MKLNLPGDEDEDSFNGRAQTKEPAAHSVNCSLCNLTMHPKSLNRHLKKMHDTEFTPSCICVDESGELYFVRKSMKGGIVYRTHVQTKVSADFATMLCEEESCVDYMNLAKKSGMPTVECIHLQLCSKCAQYTQEADLSLGSLKHLSGKGKVKLLSDQTIWMCKQLYESAKSHGARLIVPVQDDDHYINMSIFDGNTHYYAKLGRAKVTADIRQGTLDCCCCSRKRGCFIKQYANGICMKAINWTYSIKTMVMHFCRHKSWKLQRKKKR